MKPINDIFDNMDKWRHLPAYQLERRADIFFSIYLPDLLFHKLGVNIEGVIPEFPIRIGTLPNKADNNNQSFKVDYLAKAHDDNRVFFVELKTDDGSRNDEQDGYLKEAKEVGLVELLEGVRKIYQATNSKEKYLYLLRRLQDMGFMTHDSNGAFEITQADYDIQIVYIQPNNRDGERNVITFREASQVIKQHGDELSLRFSESLLEWADKKAGQG